MIRINHTSVVFLINNGGYTIEVEIHDGPYNVIKNWSYIGLVEAFHNGEGKIWTTRVRFQYYSFLVRCRCSHRSSRTVGNVVAGSLRILYPRIKYSVI